MSDKNEDFMQHAINLAQENIKSGGGPFAAVIVKDCKIIAEGANRVTLDDDPTSHAEVNAIRAASKKLKTFKLDGCSIYTTCEPCPMCLGAIYWAHIGKIFYGSSRQDAAKAGFDDDFIYREIPLPAEKRSIPLKKILSKETQAPFS